jgi:chemotaxis protein methyltransferase CheR
MEDIGIKDIKKVIETVYEVSGIDFSNYAFSSFRRRIKRFIELNKVRDFNEFIKNIRENKEYADILIKEITVNVTEMFRDPSFWTYLHDSVIPKIQYEDKLRIWHAACSTGEEVYSMAILLKESGLLNSASIVATDINKNVLKVATKGSYPLRNQEVNSKNYELFGGKRSLADYYMQTGTRVQFDKELIANVEFLCHDLALDEPIGTFDLVICRNVLIYFNFELQEKVVQTFVQSIVPNGYLGIGSKESLSWCKAARSLEEVSYEEKVYRKLATGIRR